MIFLFSSWMNAGKLVYLILIAIRTALNWNAVFLSGSLYTSYRLKGNSGDLTLTLTFATDINTTSFIVNRQWRLFL